MAGASRRAAGLLARLGAGCRNLVTALGPDEIFGHRRPILVGVGPHRLACVLARRADDRTGATGAEALAPWGRPGRAVADGGMGPQKGLELARRRRPAAGPGPPPEAFPDLSHPARGAAGAAAQDREPLP